MAESQKVPYITYQDFEIEIRPGEAGQYPLQVTGSPAGDAEEVMDFPYNAVELETHQTKLENVLLRDIGTRRLAPSDDEKVVQGYGQDLFNSLLTGKILNLFERSRDKAEGEGKGLRIKLSIKAPELAALPWEYIFDPDQSQFLSLSTYSPVVRYISLPRTRKPLQVTPPLRILGMVANPSDLKNLDIESEKRWVNEALEPLVNSGLVELKWLDGRTCDHLQAALRQGHWHIFHFIGHGDFDENSDEGLVVMEKPDGRADYVPARILGMHLSDHKSLRLVLLNSCKGAAGGEQDIFSSTASILIQQGIPAVLSMQYSITDKAAILFARSFYTVLSEGWPVDSAVSEARKTLSSQLRHSFAWGIPVLHTRAPNGELFDISAQPDVPAVSKKTEAQPQKPVQPETRTPAGQVEATFKVEPDPAQTGGEVRWEVQLTNNSQHDYAGLMLLHEDERLDDVFDLDAGETKNFIFTPVYRQVGEHTESVRLLGPGLDQEYSGSIQVQGNPDISLTLTPETDQVEPGAEVLWQVRFANTGAAPLEQIMVFRERRLLSGPQALNPGEQWLADFKQIYRQEGEHHEEVQLTAFPTAEYITVPGQSRLLERRSKASVQVRDPNRMVMDQPLKMELVRVPAGVFLMGSDKSKDSNAYDDEIPQHELDLEDYWIGKNPVTNQQFRVFVQAKGYKPPSDWNKDNFPQGKADHPVVNVSWHDAVTFCEWLSQETGKSFRLPSEAEWEKAARGEDGRIYPWGDSWDAARCNTDEGKKGTTTPVGAYSPRGDSTYGCTDMAGNVWEWTRSLWGIEGVSPSFKYPYDSNDGREDLEASSDIRRVVRGGSFNLNHRFARCAFRNRLNPVDGNNLIGFRVVVSPL